DPARVGAPLRRLRRLPPARGGAHRDRHAPAPRPRDRGPGARGAPVGGRRAAAARRRPRRGRPGERRDVPALPRAHRRGGARRRHPLQVLPARARGGQPRRAVAGARRRGDRHDRLRPLAVPAGAQAARGRRLRRGVGRDRVAAGRAAGRVDRGPPARARPGPGRRVDGPGARGPRRPAAQGADRPGRRRRPGRLRPGRALHRGRAAPPARGHPVRGAPAHRRGAPDLAARRPGRRDAAGAAAATGGGLMADFRELPDLALRSLGGAVVYANDEAFAAKENLITPGRPVFDPAAFGSQGKVYDGWETRRRREPGHDEAVVRLGAPGVVHGVVVDTAWFTGNYPPEVAVDGARADGPVVDPTSLPWEELVPRSPVAGDSENAFAVDHPRPVTHVRLRIFPDGGVARLRVHGEALPDPELLDALGTVDLAALEHGGRVVACSNAF